MTRKRISLTVAGLSLLVYGLVSAGPKPSAAILPDAEIDRIIVGGPVTECADCSCPNCWGSMCGDGGWDDLAGWLCKDVDAWNWHEDCNCNGWGFTSPYCHVLTEVDCLEYNTYQKSAYSNCTVVDPRSGLPMPCASGGHTFLGTSDPTRTYDECTETDSNPHEE